MATRIEITTVIDGDVTINERWEEVDFPFVGSIAPFGTFPNTLVDASSTLGEEALGEFDRFYSTAPGTTIKQAVNVSPDDIIEVSPGNLQVGLATPVLSGQILIITDPADTFSSFVGWQQLEVFFDDEETRPTVEEFMSFDDFDDLLEFDPIINGDDDNTPTAGDDIIVGTDASDVINAGEGNDDVSGGKGGDRLKGAQGDDRLDGDAGRDRLFGGGGDDDLFGGNGGDKIFGGRGSDDLYGDRGNDLLNGGGGDDFLYGGPGRDVMNGGNGNDYFEGGGGNDKMTGGKGADTFVFFGEDLQGRDKITDFNVTEDLLFLRDVNGNGASGSDARDHLDDIGISIQGNGNQFVLTADSARITVIFDTPTTEAEFLDRMILF